MKIDPKKRPNITEILHNNFFMEVSDEPFEIR